MEYNTNVTRLVRKAIVARPAKVFESNESKAIRVFKTTLEQCREAQSRCRRRLIFGFETALKLCCVDVPSDVPDRGLVAIVSQGTERRNVNGVTFVVRSHPWSVIDIDGIPCTSPLATWMMFANSLPLDALVRLGDALTRRDRDQKWYTVAVLEEAVDGIGAMLSTREGQKERKVQEAQKAQKEGEAQEAQKRRKARLLPAGIENSRRALRLMRDNTDSFPETDLRLLLLRYGLPCPAVNPCVVVGSGRRYFLDMAYESLKIGIEYDGAHHGLQREEDAARRRELEEAGWIVVSVENGDVIDADAQERFVMGLAGVIERRLGHKVRLRAPLTVRQLADRRRTIHTDFVPGHCWPVR